MILIVNGLPRFPLKTGFCQIRLLKRHCLNQEVKGPDIPLTDLECQDILRRNNRTIQTVQLHSEV